MTDTIEDAESKYSSYIICDLAEQAHAQSRAFCPIPPPGKFNWLVSTAMTFPGGTMVKLTRAMAHESSEKALLNEKSLQIARLRTMLTFWSALS